MVKRILVAVIFVPLLLLLFYWLAPAWPWTLCVVFAGLSMLAVHEALWSTGFLKHPRVSGYSIVMAGLIPFWVYYSGELMPALLGLYVYVVLLFCEAIGSHKRLGLEKLGGAFLLAVAIPLFLSAFLRIRLMEHWRPLIILPLVVAFLSDAFALFAGMACGKDKLAPERWAASWGPSCPRWSTAWCSASASSMRWTISAWPCTGPWAAWPPSWGTCPFPISSGNTASRISAISFPAMAAYWTGLTASFSVRRS